MKLFGLIREGDLLTKSSDKDVFGSFSVLLSHILQNQHKILRLKYINSTQFLSQFLSGSSQKGQRNSFSKSLLFLTYDIVNSTLTQQHNVSHHASMLA